MRVLPDGALCSVNSVRIRLGRESLRVTLAYLKGKDAESEEAQEHTNSSSLALYAYSVAQQTYITGRFLNRQTRVSRSHFLQTVREFTRDTSSKKPL